MENEIGLRTFAQQSETDLESKSASLGACFAIKSN